MRILSGIQPSGALHIGNYFGMMQPAVALQTEGEALYFIADYHALTSLRDPQALRAVGVLPDAKRLAESVRNGTPISLNFKPVFRSLAIPLQPVVDEPDEVLI